MSPRFPQERRSYIEKKLRSEGKIRVSELSSLFDVSLLNGKKVGDVKKGDILLVNETDRAVFEEEVTTNGKISPDLMIGGTFNVTNLGTLGIESITPVINPPQTAILGVCTLKTMLKPDGTPYQAMGGVI